jgi:hypothetical protein
MDVPRELRWIGPLFLVTYLILWARRGVSAIVAILIYPLNPYMGPFIVVGALILYHVFQSRKQYFFPAIVLFLSLFFSGVMYEYIPVPWMDPGPHPPAVLMLPSVLLAPVGIPILILQASLSLSTQTILSLLVLSILPYLTCYIVWSVPNEEESGVHAMLYIVVILICWTFLVIPLTWELGPHGILTPIPLGPLVALNILPWVPLRIVQQPESQE